MVLGLYDFIVETPADGAENVRPSPGNIARSGGIEGEARAVIAGFVDGVGGIHASWQDIASDVEPVVCPRPCEVEQVAVGSQARGLAAQLITGASTGAIEDRIARYINDDELFGARCPGQVKVPVSADGQRRPVLAAAAGTNLCGAEVQKPSPRIREVDLAVGVGPGPGDGELPGPPYRPASAGPFAAGVVWARVTLSLKLFPSFDNATLRWCWGSVPVQARAREKL